MGIQQDFFQYAGKGLRPDFYLALLALCVTMFIWMWVVGLGHGEDTLHVPPRTNERGKKCYCTKFAFKFKHQLTTAHCVHCVGFLLPCAHDRRTSPCSRHLVSIKESGTAWCGKLQWPRQMIGICQIASCS